VVVIVHGERTGPVGASAGAAEVGVAETFDDAFASLFRAAYRVAFRLLGDREDAADIAQEALARASVRWAKVTAGDRSPTPWVVRVAANLALDRWRRRKVAARYAASVAASERASANALPERVDLHRALAALPRRQREVVVLRYVADMAEADVAAALGCSTGTVKTHASRGLAALRVALGEEVEAGEEPEGT
jgi:RNA polymerase sigma-70 factor (sigma-E family)